MKITVQSSTVVMPSSSGGRRPSAAIAEAVPLTVFDKVNYDLYVYGLYFFRPPAPPSSVLEAGLAAALAEYPEWAGRLGFDARGNRTTILLNDAGARFVEATADVPLHSVRPLEPATPETVSLHPSGEDAADGQGQLMLVQVTRFTCGSFVVGTAAHHAVADSLALRSFVNAWGQATRGAAVVPVPVHDRVSVFVPRDPPRVEFEHRGAEYKKPQAGRRTTSRRSNVDDDEVVVVHRVNFSREFIAELKARASAPSLSSSYSTLQCVAAHLWRCVTKARRLDGRTATELRVAVNGRARLHHPRVSDGHAGNVVLWARPATTAGDLVRRPLQEAVELVSKAVAAMDDKYFRSFIDFASSGVVEEEGLVPTATVDPLETTLSPDVEVESLLGLPFQDFDFGCGPPFFFMPSYPPVEGGIFIVSSFSGDGSIDAYVPLFTQAMHVFKNCCHSLAAADARV